MVEFWPAGLGVWFLVGFGAFVPFSTICLFFPSFNDDLGTMPTRRPYSWEKNPLQKMLMVQMQQNQVLLGSSSGVKGCMAREAFLRAVADLPKVANSTRANALRELGMDPSREDGSLIRRYMERRMPLAEHRLLTYFTAMLAEAWAVGYNSGNVEMLGILSRMLFFTEQCSIDQGRTSMAWLLAGWQEPPFHLLTSAKRHPGLQPYARLCHPAWVSANIAYVKDIDYLEGRLQSLGTSKPKKTQDDSDYQTKQNPKLKPRKPKGTGKGGRQDAASTDAGARQVRSLPCSCRARFRADRTEL